MADDVTSEQLDQIDDLRKACRDLDWKCGLALNLKAKDGQPAGIVGAVISRSNDGETFVLPCSFWPDLVALMAEEPNPEPEPASGRPRAFPKDGPAQEAAD